MTQVKSERMRIVAIFGAILIGMLFALLSVYAFWNPAKNMENIEVPVVVLDQGAEQDGETVNFGNDIAENIADNDSVKWKVYYENIFADGIENTDYFFGFVIPEDFSRSIVDASDEPSEKVHITYLGDARKNFLMSQMSGNVRNAFSQIISQSISEQYAKAVYEGLDEAAEGMGEAAEGSQKITDGLDKSKKGADKLNAGAGELEDGAASLENGLGDLTNGTKQLKTGSKSLANGAATLAKSTGDLAAGINTVKEQTGEAIEAYTAGVSGYAAGYKTLYEGLQASPLWAMVPEEQRAGMAMLYEQSDTLDKKGEALYTGVDGGLDQLYQSAKKLETGADKVADSAGTLKDATATLNDGMETARSGASTLSKGAAELSSGTKSLASGQKTLSEGSQELTDSLSEGENTIKDKMGNDTDGMSSFIAEPLETDSEIYGETDHYGLGLAPMFLSLGLWIGSLILFFAVPLPMGRGIAAGRWAAIFGGYSTFLLFDIIVATAVSLGAIFLVGIEPQSILAFFLWALFCGAVFLSILYMLHVVFGELPGKAVGIMFIVFQIATSGGAIAPQLENEWLQAISPMFPMRYSIDGFREVIFGGNWSNLTADLAPLLLWILISLILATVCWRKAADYD